MNEHSISNYIFFAICALIWMGILVEVVSCTDTKKPHEANPAIGTIMIFTLVSLVLCKFIWPNFLTLSEVLSIQFLCGVPIYLGIGILYSLYGWMRHCNHFVNNKLKYQYDRSSDKSWELEHHINMATSELLNMEDNFPHPLKNKALISTFILFWPICALKVLVKLLLSEFIDSAIELLNRVYIAATIKLQQKLDAGLRQSRSELEELLKQQKELEKKELEKKRDVEPSNIIKKL